MSESSLALPSLVLVGSLVLAVDMVSAQQIPRARAGFRVRAFAAVDRPLALALPDATVNAQFGNYLYVATGVPDYGAVAGTDPVMRIDLSTRLVESFFNLPGESDPTTITFGPGSPFTTNLYVTSNNRDGNRSGDQGGAIVFLESNPALLGEQFLTSVSPSTVLSEPFDAVFGPGFGFGSDLFVANTSDTPFDIARISPSGSRSSFGVYPTPLHSFLAFSPGGLWGVRLFQADSVTGTLYSIDSSGVRTFFAAIPGFSAGDIMGGPHFAPAGIFGGDMYVSWFRSGLLNILRIDPTGQVSPFSHGYLPLASTVDAFFRMDAIEFAHDGTALYVADYGADTVYLIERDKVQRR